MKQCKECLIELTADNWEVCQHCGSSFCNDCIRTSVGEGHECGLSSGWNTHLNIKFTDRGVQLRIIQSEEFPKVFRFKQSCDGNTDIGVPESWARLILDKKWKSEDFKESVEIRLPSNQSLTTEEVCCKDCKFCTDFVKGLCKTPEDKTEFFTSSRNEFGTCSLFQSSTTEEEVE